MTFDLTPISVKKADGTPVPMIAYNDSTNSAFAHAVVDSTGAIINPATSGLQTTANSALATIATQTNGVATAAAQATGNTSLAAVATSTANADTNLGAKADTAASSDTGTFSLIALVKRLLQSTTTLTSRTPALGSALSAASTPVVIASDQAALPLPTGAATAAAQTTGNTALTTIATNTTGVATAANQSTANTSLATIATNTTGVATATNQTSANTKLDSIVTNTTGVATAANQSTANTALGTIATNTTGLATSAKQDTLLAAMSNTRAHRTIVGTVGANPYLTRAANATSYTTGDMIADSATPGSVTPFVFAGVASGNDVAGLLAGAIVEKNGASDITGSIFELHLFNAAPVVSVGSGDNLAFKTTLMSSWVGVMTGSVVFPFGDGAKGILRPRDGTFIEFQPESGGQRLWGLLRAGGDWSSPVAGEQIAVKLLAIG